MSVCPSVRMYQRRSHWTDLSEIWRLKKLQFVYNRTQISGTLRDVASKFVLQRAGRRILLFDKRAKGKHLALFRDMFMSTALQREVIIACPWQQCLQ